MKAIASAALCLAVAGLTSGSSALADYRAVRVFDLSANDQVPPRGIPIDRSKSGAVLFVDATTPVLLDLDAPRRLGADFFIRIVKTGPEPVAVISRYADFAGAGGDTRTLNGERAAGSIAITRGHDGNLIPEFGYTDNSR